MNVELGTWNVALFLSALFGVAAYATRFLNASGALTAALFGFCILYFGGLGWAVPPLTFFILASLLSVAGKSLRSSSVQEQTRGSRRDAVQVISNGGVGWGVLILFALRPDPELFWVYAGSFAAAASDTWATEIGTAVGGKTVSIVGGGLVNPGTSGGVSAAGTAASLLGAGSIIVASLLAAPTGSQWTVGSAVVIGGIAGSLVDSILGATIQGRVPGVNNDTVNLACTLTGAAVAAAILYL